MSESQICGADGQTIEATSCIYLNRNSWVDSEIELETPRWGHSAWRRDNGTLLMGGGEKSRDWTSTEFVNSPQNVRRGQNKLTTHKHKHGAHLMYEARYTCAIQLGDSIVLTGLKDPKSKTVKGWQYNNY